MDLDTFHKITISTNGNFLRGKKEQFPVNKQVNTK